MTSELDFRREQVRRLALRFVEYGHVGGFFVCAGCRDYYAPTPDHAEDQRARFGYCPEPAPHSAKCEVFTEDGRLREME